MGAIDPHGAASFGPKGHGLQDLCKQSLDIVKEYHQSVKQFGSRSDSTKSLTFCQPDLFTNCLQKLSAEDTSRQRVKSHNLQRFR